MAFCVSPTCTSARSPVYNADKIKVPVLLARGAIDQRVPIEHAHRLRAALKKAGNPPEWLVERREGHGFRSEENQEALYQKILMVAEAQKGVADFSESDAEAIEDKSMVFVLREREQPYTNLNFLMSFSLPNFYFHVATVYDILRTKGVALGKPDYLGLIRVG